MKKIVASVGLVALGAANLNAASEVSAAPTKPWSASLTLRGFYDDNIAGRPDGAGKVDSFGFEVKPAINFALDTGRTEMSAGYALSYKHFDRTPPGQPANDEQDYYLNHMFRGDLLHHFSERYQLSVTDSFVIGQEPDQLQGGSLQPIPGDNIRNFGAVAFTAWITPLLGVEVGYDNEFWKYDSAQSGMLDLSDLLDRIQHTGRVEGKWRFRPQTMGLFGYEFGLTDYRGDDDIGPGISPSDRNYRSHAFYVGATHLFRPDLSGALKVGGKYLDYYNEPMVSGDLTPYVLASLRYTFAPESYVEAGGRYDVTSTDIVSPTPGGDYTRHAETAAVWGSLYHQIFPRLYGNITGQVQNSRYEGGAADGDSHTFFSFGASLEYWILRNLSAHIGYNFDAVDASANSIGSADYTRNRVYIGVTGRY